MRYIAAALIIISLIVTGCSSGRNAFIGRGNWRSIKRVAVLPFENLSGRTDAGDIVTSIFISELFKSGRFDIVKPGDVRNLLIERKVKVKGEIDFETLYSFRKELGTDAVIVGVVEEYREKSGKKGSDARVSLAVRMLDAWSGRVIWSANESRQGRENVVILDIGEVRTADGLAGKIIEDMLRPITRPSLEKKYSVPAGKTAGFDELNVRLAEMYFERGKYEAAADHLETVLSMIKDKEESKPWMYKLGISYEKIGRWSDALRIWESYRKLYPFERVYEMRFRVGRAQLNIGNYEEARRELELVCNDTDNRWIDDAYFELGRLYFDTGEYEKVRKIYGKLMIEYPASKLVSDVVLSRGKNRYRLKDYRGAIEILTSFMKKFSSDKKLWEAAYITGMSYKELGNWQKAAHYLQRSIKEGSKDVLREEIRYWIGVSYWKLGELKWAEGYLSTLDRKKLDQQKVDDLRFMLGSIYYEFGEYEKALSELEGLIYEGKADSQLIYKAARCNEELGRLKEALSLYNRVVTEGGGRFLEESLMHMGDIYRQLDEVEKAVDVYKRLASLGGIHEIRAKIELAGLYFRRGDLDEALKLYEDVVETSSDPEAASKARNWIKTIEYKKEKLRSGEK